MKLGLLLPWVSLGVFSGLPSTQSTASEVDAAGYYKLRCATCHGPSGEGTRDKSPSLGPPLRGNPFVINAPVEMLMSVIRNGRGGQQRVYDDAFPNMPAFDAGMVPDPIGLATYLKTVLQQQDVTSHRSDPTSPGGFSNGAGRGAPAQVSATGPIDDGDEVHKVARHLDVRQVNDPDPDQPTDMQLSSPTHQLPLGSTD